MNILAVQESNFLRHMWYWIFYQTICSDKLYSNWNVKNKNVKLFVLENPENFLYSDTDSDEFEERAINFYVDEGFFETKCIWIFFFFFKLRE